MGRFKGNMRSQKRTKPEGSGRQKWKKVMTKTGGKRLRVRVAWNGIEWQRMNLGWKLTLGHHKVRRQSGAGSG